MTQRVTTSQVLKLCGNIARGTLYRWMNAATAEHIGIEQFPAGGRRDGKSRDWELAEVEQWLDRNAGKLDRQPRLRPRREGNDKGGVAIDLTLGQAIEAAVRVAKEDNTSFDAGEFEAKHIAPMVAALQKSLRSRGASKASWTGNRIAFAFPQGEHGDAQAVMFKLTFA